MVHSVYETVTLGEIYTQRLEQKEEIFFEGIFAILNMIAIGADASNIFAKTPPYIAPLFVKLDTQDKDEWTECKKRSPIPHGYCLREGKYYNKVPSHNCCGII